MISRLTLRAVKKKERDETLYAKTLSIAPSIQQRLSKKGNLLIRVIDIEQIVCFARACFSAGS